MCAMIKTSKRKTVTFQPAKDVQSLLRKAVVRTVGRNGETHGVQTRLINDALRKHFAALAGKREAA